MLSAPGVATSPYDREGMRSKTRDETNVVRWWRGRSKPSAAAGQTAGLFRDLEARGELHRDTGIGRIYHPGALSYREAVSENALHVIVRGDHVSAHIDRVSPIEFPEKGQAHYSIWRTAVHNLAGMAEGTMRALGARRPNSRCEPAGEWIEVDDDLITRVLHPDNEAELPAGAIDRLRRVLDEGGAAGVRLVPFNVVDEIVHLIDRDADPWSVQLEARVDGRLDEERLRTAVGQALGRHPMARARKGASPRRRNRDYWEIPQDLDLDPLRTIDCPDEAALSAARAELQSQSVPLSQSPPLRVWLARTPDRDVVMLNVNHAATDGFGAVRLLQSVGRAYANEADPLAHVDFLAERSLTGRLPGPIVSAWVRHQLALAERLRDLVTPPARLSSHRGSQQPGYGFHQVRLDPEETQRLVGLDHAGTVNDLLVAALHLAVGTWNDEHQTPCRRVSVLVPANLHPSEWRTDLVGNFSLPTRVSTNRSDRATPARALAAITAQTRQKKRSGVGTAFLEILSRSWLLPLRAKRTLVDLIGVLGDRFLDTAILSDLGRVEDPPSFGADAGEVDALWFSAPAPMPLGLSVGAITVRDRLHLVFRYRHAQFDADAARRFADGYLAQLQRVADSLTL